MILPLAHTAALRSLLLAAMLLAVVLAWRQSVAEGQVPWRGLGGLFLLMLAWLGLALASLPGSLDVGESLAAVKGDVLYAILVFSGGLLLARVPQGFVRLRRGVLVGLALLSLLAVGFAWQNGGVWVVSWQNALGEFATAVLLLLPLALATLFHPENTPCFRGLPAPLTWERGLAVLAVVLTLVACYYTRSRALWGILGLMLGVFLVCRLPGRSPWRFLLLVLPLCLAVGVAYRVSHERNTPLTALNDRDRIYSFAIDQGLERPWLGHGFGREVNRDAYKEAFPNGGIRHAHNVVLSYGEQMGAPGVALILALFAAPFIAFWRRRRIAPGVALVGIVMVAGYLVKNLTDNFFTAQNLSLFWLLCGGLLGLIYPDRNRDV